MKAVKFRKLENGVEIAEMEDGTQMHKCQHEDCGILFKPKARFRSKYCCESCRVLAHRKNKSLKLGGETEQKSKEIAKNIEDDGVYRRTEIIHQREIDMAKAEGFKFPYEAK